MQKLWPAVASSVFLTALSGQAKALAAPAPTDWGADARSTETPVAKRSSQDRPVRPQSPPPPVNIPVPPVPLSPRTEDRGPPVIVPGPPPAPRAGSPPPAAPQTGVVFVRPPRPVYPERATDEELSATVDLQCVAASDGTVHSCSVINESVTGFGFGGAALTAGRASRVAPQSAGRAIQFRITFRAPPPEVSRSTRVSAPRTAASQEALSWYSRPSPIYPDAAFRANVVAIVSLSCRATSNGTLDACRVESEGVQNMGFGAAALRSIPGSRLTLGSAARASGERVRFDIAFLLE